MIRIVKEKKQNIFSVQEWIPISDILHDKVVLKDGTIVKILEIEPINFELKSEFEKEAILEAYKRFLKACNFDFQIIVQSQITDISKHFEKIKKLREKDDVIKEMAEDYINFVQEFTNSKRNFSRKFYIIIKGEDNMEDKIAKIKEGLGSCGNFVQECNTEKLIIIMKNCFNKRLRGLERVMI